MKVTTEQIKKLKEETGAPVLRVKKVLEEFPALGGEQDIKFNNPNELKLASQGEYRFGENTKKFMHFLNSQPFHSPDKRRIRVCCATKAEPP